jgi:hypothetical protein
MPLSFFEIHKIKINYQPIILTQNNGKISLENRVHLSYNSYMYNTIKNVIKSRHFLLIFSIGLILRIGFLFGFYYLSDKDMNDMNEKVWIALSRYVAHGINPYGQTYSMNVMDLSGDNANKEAFFQYPPFSLVALAPTLLWPFSPSYGPTNFMPAFCIMSVLASIMIFYILFQRGYKHSAFVFWIVMAPLITIFDFSTFTSLPLLLLVLALINKDKPLQSGIFIGLGIATYTYLAIPALFLLLYNMKGGPARFRKFFIGLTPAIAIVLFFFLLNPPVFINDIFVSQATNKPANFLYPSYSIPGGPSYWWMHVYSLTPYINTLYNAIIDPSRRLQFPNLTLSLTIAALSVTVFLLYRLAKDSDGRKVVFYSFVSLFILTIVSAKGFPHYLLFPLVHLAFFLDPVTRRIVRKKEPVVRIPAYIPQNEQIAALESRSYSGRLVGLSTTRSQKRLLPGRKRNDTTKINVKPKMAWFKKMAGKIDESGKL